MHRKHNRLTLALTGAMALLATDALAQQGPTGPSLYGLIDLSVNRTQAPGAQAVKGVDSGKMSTSYFGFKGDEDLGGGLKAIYTLESFMRNNTGLSGRFNGDAFFARSSYVGISSAQQGTLTLGRITTSLFVQTLLFNAFSDSFGYSPAIRHVFTSGTVTGDTAWNNSARYASPKFGAFGFALQGALGQGDGGRNVGANVSYFAGAIGAGLAWQKAEQGATIADTEAWQAAGSYDFGTAKLFAQYTKVDNDTTGRNFDIVGVGVTAPAGPGKIMAQWGQIDPDVGAKRKTLSLGYGYALSKRTDVYAVYMNDKISGLSSGNSYGVGIRHSF
ncbi:MAG: porin [Ideonella sp.]|nr:porin [Ideonella sp.]MCC7458372.1 porin [Nitrospira sp.]